MTAFSRPAVNIAAARNARAGRRPLWSRIAEVCRRWLAAFEQARLRRAARHLDTRISCATGTERAELLARAEALRLSLE